MKRQACKWWCKYLESSTTSIWSKKKLKKYIFGSSWSNVKKLSTSKLKVHQALDHPVLELTKKHSIFCKKQATTCYGFETTIWSFLNFQHHQGSSLFQLFLTLDIPKFWNSELKKFLKLKKFLEFKKFFNFIKFLEFKQFLKISKWQLKLLICRTPDRS